MSYSRCALRPALALSLFAAALAPTGASAQEEADRPEEEFLSDLVFPQEHREVQVTAAPALAEVDTRQSLVTGLELEYGITDAWQVEAGWGAHPLVADADYTFEVGTQYSALNIAGTGFHTAFGVEAEWEGAEFEAAVPYLILAADFGALHAFTQGFVAIGGEGDDDEIDLDLAVGDVEEAEGDWGLLGGAVLPVGPVFVTAEAAWSRAAFGDRLTLAPGLVAPIAEGWQVGLGLPITRVGGGTSAGLSAFLTYEFELGDDDD